MSDIKKIKDEFLLKIKKDLDLNQINKIKYLRNIKDSLHLRRELETATDIVLLGAGYISFRNIIYNKEIL